MVSVDFGDPVGSKPGFVRPAVIVTAQAVLGRGPRTVHVVPVTTNVRRSLPTEVLLDESGLPRPSAAQCHLCTVIGTQRIVSDDGHSVGPAVLAQIRSVLADLLDID